LAASMVIVINSYKCLAVAEMGDCLATIDMSRKLGAVSLFLGVSWGKLELHVT